jgi:hypothetical protein
MIDDFEDGDESVDRREGRFGAWVWVNDTDPKGASPALIPERRPEGSTSNRLAAHIHGAELRDWGASLEVTFWPPCYDASAYSAIAFSARGPGRIYVSAREVRTIPTEWGGTCTADCYNTHQQKVDLDARWRSFEIRFGDLRQRGYGMPAFDPTMLHSIAFYVRGEDTPYDLWIDDVRFTRD